MSEENKEIRDSFEVLSKIISILPKGEVKDDLIKYKKSRVMSLRYSAPEGQSYVHMKTFNDLSFMLPNLEIDKDLKEKVKKIFMNED